MRYFFNLEVVDPKKFLRDADYLITKRRPLRKKQSIPKGKFIISNKRKKSTYGYCE